MDWEADVECCINTDNLLQDALHLRLLLCKALFAAVLGHQLFLHQVSSLRRERGWYTVRLAYEDSDLVCQL